MFRPRLAALTFTRKTVVHVNPGVPITLAGKPVESMELRPDSKQDRLVIGDLTFFVHASGKRYGIRVKDKNNHLRKEFKGLHWYPVDPAYRFTARYVAYPSPREIQIENLVGDRGTTLISGYVVFSLDGKEYRLDAEKDMIRAICSSSFATLPARQTPTRPRGSLMPSHPGTAKSKSTSTRPTTHPAHITHMQRVLYHRRETACRWQFPWARRDITRRAFVKLSRMAQIAYLECSKCGEHISGAQPQTICPKDGGSLYVRYDLASLKGKFTPDSLRGRLATMWRYHEVLPGDVPVTLGEGFTPMLPSRENPNVYIKDEGLNPTGIFKARGLCAAVTMARHMD